MSIPCHLKTILSTKEQVLPMRTSETPQQCYCTCKLSWQITYSNCCHLSASLTAPGKSQLIEWKCTIILLESWGEIPSSWRTSISQEISWEMLTMLLDTDRQNSAEFSRKSSLAQRLETEDSNKKNHQLFFPRWRILQFKFVYVHTFFVNSLLLIYLLCLFLHYIYWMQKPD